METIWSMLLFLLPIITIIFFYKGIINYLETQKFNSFNKALITLIITIFYFSLVFYISNDSQKKFEEKVIGQYKFSNNKNIILTINPDFTFRLNKQINKEYFDTGNWEIDLNDWVLVTLNFKNDKNLVLIYDKHDSTLSNYRFDGTIKFVKVD